MSVPRQQADPGEPEQSDAGNVPVNIAPPNWQCPTCGTAFQQDLDAATACAHAGPAPHVEAGVPVLALSSVGVGPPIFGLAEVGPVTSILVGGKRQHGRNVVVSGLKIDSRQLAAAPEGHDGLRIVVPSLTRAEPSEPSPTLQSSSGLAAIFRPQNDYYTASSYGLPKTSVWVPDWGRGVDTWWAAPNSSQRAAFNVVTAGLLDAICEMSEDDLAELIRAGYKPSFSRGRTSWGPRHLASPECGIAIARAHGAPNHIWALRWLAVHLNQVTTWQARTLKAWATGDEASATVAIPGPRYLPIPERLPRNPGKRRLAIMDPYGEDYEQVRKVITGQLTVPAPTNPVPGVPDVTTTIRASRTNPSGETATNLPEGN